MLARRVSEFVIRQGMWKCYMRMNCGVCSIPPNTPNYPAIQPQNPYLQEHPQVLYVNVQNEQTFHQLPPKPIPVQQMPAESMVPATVMRLSTEQTSISPSHASINSESEGSSNNSATPPYHVAPRFKNKRRLNKNCNNNNNPNCLPCVGCEEPRNITQRKPANKFIGAPLLQGSEVSTTCTSPIAQTVPPFPPPIPPVSLPPMSYPPPAPILPPIPPPPPHAVPQQTSNRYMPVQPSFSTPYYFQQVEYESYSPVTYYECGVYEHPGGVYPAMVLPPSQFPSAPYINTDGGIYH